MTPANVLIRQEDKVVKLAESYLAFTSERPKLWNLLFEHYMPADSQAPAWYQQKLELLMSRVETAMAPLFPEGADVGYAGTWTARRPSRLAVVPIHAPALREPFRVRPAADLDVGDIVLAAETAETGKLRKDALAAIEQLKMKGPAYRRELSTWGKIGQGALAVGCVAAAATGHIELGLPCVIGGGATNAAAYYMNDR